MVNSNFLSDKILSSRSQYQPCHIQVPDLEKRLPAIRVGDRYYSLFKVEPERDRAVRILEKLLKRGDDALIIQTTKGYVVWVWEPEAHPENFAQPSQSINSPPTPSRNFDQVPILTSRNLYQPCHIRVPDLKQRLAAIKFEGAYYSLFRIETDLERAIERIQQLNQRSDKAVITPSPRGYIIWVLEPEAQVQVL